MFNILFYRNCNVANASDPYSPVTIPDVSAFTILSQSTFYQLPIENLIFPKFSMAAGDFVALYDTPDNHGSWDAIVTCYFIDTAPVVLEYKFINNLILRLFTLF